MLDAEHMADRNAKLDVLTELVGIPVLRYICVVDYTVTLVTRDGNIEAVGETETEALQRAIDHVKDWRSRSTEAPHA